ncbi:hypothetical protein V5799_019033 [Amblyomma americanum]|uniref:Uncharacterized protein n=1 Tax=Amblyomma americanum TaxID=6943 RepID=A0AAQ4EXN9_AMBAM
MSKLCLRVLQILEAHAALHHPHSVGNTRTHARVPANLRDLSHWYKRLVYLSISSEVRKDLANTIEDSGRKSHCTAYENPYDPNDTTVLHCVQWDYDAETVHSAVLSSWNLVCH